MQEVLAVDLCGSGGHLSARLAAKTQQAKPANVNPSPTPVLTVSLWHHLHHLLQLSSSPIFFFSFLFDSNPLSELSSSLCGSSTGVRNAFSIQSPPSPPSSIQPDSVCGLIQPSPSASPLMLGKHSGYRTDWSSIQSNLKGATRRGTMLTGKF